MKQRLLPGNALVLLSMQLAYGAGAGTGPVVFDVREHSLDNGLRILTLEDHSSPLVSFQVHYAVGSRNERPGITGISHLFEHMMFKGTEKRGPEQIAREVQAQGGTLNAFTTTDNTSYFENLPSDKLELAIDIEADRMGHLRIDDPNLQTEREVVRNERKLRTVNTPTGLPEELMMSLLFDSHPYNWPVVGWDADLKAITLQDCLDYFRIHYAPNNATVVIVGDFDTDQAVSLVKKHFGSIPAGPPPPPVPTYERTQRGEKRAIYKKVAQEPGFIAGFHAPAWGDPDWAALELIETAMTAGRSSRLYKKFIKPGRASDLDVSSGIFFGTMDPSLVEVSVTAGEGVDIGSLEKEIWDEFDRLAREGLSESELAKVKKQRQASFYLQAQSNFFRGIQIGLRQMRQGSWKGLNTQVDQWRGVTGEDLKRVASRIFRADNRTVVTIQPVSAEDWASFGPAE